VLERLRAESLVIPLVRGPVLITLAVVAALAGCQESGFDESKETQRPLKVQHALNPLTGTKVPGLAERPITLSADTLGDALALGVRPVRAALPGARPPDYMRRAARGVEVVPPLTELDLAATEAAEPDLILGTKEGDGDLYDQLTRIAPTVMSEGHDWKLNLRLHGEALGRTNDAERLLIDWDNRVARVRKTLAGSSVAAKLAEPNPFAESILADVGVEPGPKRDALIRIDPGPEWSGGGLLAARAALADLARILSR
jgi:iron complex transport system substrate-binding protein